MNHKSDTRNTSKKALFLGSASAGMLELSLFHPVDTIAKRLMNNQTKILSVRPISKMLFDANSVMFKDAAEKSVMYKYSSLFPGFGFALGYKIFQRVYKFAGQPIVNELLWKHSEGLLEPMGPSRAKTLTSAISGSIIGLGEVLLLPLDSLKVKFQTSSDPKINALALMKSEGVVGLYHGAAWTAMRNIPGSFALFGASAFTKEFVFKLENHSKATFTQDLISSVAGAVTCIMISSPFDVIKTRIQASSIHDKVNGITILRNMVLNEGLSSFIKGVTPKIFVLGPKLMFGYTISQQLAQVFDTLINTR